MKLEWETRGSTGIEYGYLPSPRSVVAMCLTNADNTRFTATVLLGNNVKLCGAFASMQTARTVCEAALEPGSGLRSESVHAHLKAQRERLTVHAEEANKLALDATVRLANFELENVLELAKIDEQG